jgi:hypothetical protein
LGLEVPPPRLVVPDQEAAADFLGAPARRGFYSRVAFQPTERFWSFQAVEVGIFAAVAPPLLALTVWWVPRRAA